MASAPTKLFEATEQALTRIATVFGHVIPREVAEFVAENPNIVKAAEDFNKGEQATLTELNAQFHTKYNDKGVDYAKVDLTSRPIRAAILDAAEHTKAHEYAMAQLDESNRIADDLRRQLGEAVSAHDAELAAHAETQGKLATEQTGHAETRGNLEGEKAEHAKTHEQLAAEQAERQKAEAALAAEQQARADAEQAHQTEQTEHATTRDQLAQSQDHHQQTWDALEAERRAHATTTQERDTAMQERDDARKELADRDAVPDSLNGANLSARARAAKPAVKAAESRLKAIEKRKAEITAQLKDPKLQLGIDEKKALRKELEKINPLDHRDAEIDLRLAQASTGLPQYKFTREIEAALLQEQKDNVRVRGNRLADKADDYGLNPAGARQGASSQGNLGTPWLTAIGNGAKSAAESVPNFVLGIGRDTTAAFSPRYTSIDRLKAGLTAPAKVVLWPAIGYGALKIWDTYEGWKLKSEGVSAVTKANTDSGSPGALFDAMDGDQAPRGPRVRPTAPYGRPN